MTLAENQRHVQDEAFNRYVENLERDAKEAVSEQTRWHTTVQTGLAEEVNEKARKREAASKNQTLLKEQMESNKARRADLRREYIQSASTHSFPLFTETFIDVEEFERVRKSQREQWRQELDQQKTTNDMLRMIEEKKVRDLAEKNHRQNLTTMTHDRRGEYDRLANQGRDLVASWKKDVHLKALRRAMDTGTDVTKEVGKSKVRVGGCAQR